MKKSILCLVLIAIVMLSLPMHTCAYSYGENDVIIDFIPGDIDGNEIVNSADARLCLRAAAKLETLTDEQIKAIDFDSTGTVNSADARQILRAAAQLEIFELTINIEKGQNIVVGALHHSGIFFWDYKKNSDELAVDLVIEDTVPPDLIGGCDDMFYVINADSTGDSEIRFIKECPWTSEVNISFVLNVIKK
ncbi:MAG: dockerin type I repeat-containing protein [Clostridia bacterium]|nr:dockerin type I repeat-containing protein [Clostridia bacterium]